MHRPNWLKFTIWLVVAPAAPAPTVGSSENVCALLYGPPQLLPATTGLPSTFGFLTLRHFPFSDEPSVVPWRFALSFVLHCCCGSVLAPQGRNTTGSWSPGARPASRHMPSGFDAVRDETS